MLMNLWVRDKTSGVVHQVGTYVHDSLEFISGRVEYVNMQNGCGTGDDERYGYEFPVSDTQAYKMLGNGWTVDVIAHLLSYIRWAI